MNTCTLGGTCRYSYQYTSNVCTVNSLSTSVMYYITDVTRYVVVHVGTAVALVEQFMLTLH